MTFKRSIWWGIAGGVALSVLEFTLVSANKWLTDTETRFLLWLGLNPREQGLWCLLLEIGVTFVIGFLVGRGLSLAGTRQHEKQNAD